MVRMVSSVRASSAKSRIRIVQKGVSMPSGPFASSIGVGRAEPEWVRSTDFVAMKSCMCDNVG